MLPNHFYKFLVHNTKDLELLLMHNTKYAAQIASGVSTKKRLEIIERAAQLDVKVLNPAARVRTEDAE
jgi:large subunit ribosomal protein L32e